MENWITPADSHKLLLVGPRRTGKSSSGNTLLGGEVFDTRGGGVSTAADAVTSGCHLTVVDAQGWGSAEESVTREEKIEQLRALSLCGSGGPHVVLLVIPLLDFTESERGVVERRMEIFTDAVWRHTMVLFTFGDCLKARGRSVQQHIQSGGPALCWLMEKCRYRYHVLNNKAAKQERLKQKVQCDDRKQEGQWWKKNGAGGMGQEQKQVRELLSKVEDMLEENGGWHFSLHMYQRLEEEWSRREQQLRARLEAETYVERRQQKTAETKVKVKPELEQSVETEASWRKEPEKKEECVKTKIRRGEDKKQRLMVEFSRQSSTEEGWNTSSDSGEEREEGRAMVEVERMKIISYWPEGQRLNSSPIRSLA
ncbi:GTPase IMAP family member 7 [Parambassis ranga]|uniref:GTPase IMAP family member 7 n=1 Tax=Parambassis ranga TaxID=210632 RepID=A0A6P7K0D3_9TELE|nr:GTPase IMAP family member 7-like [Parambassis ranga]